MEATNKSKKYKYTNKAPIGCNDCSSCSECCHNMGDSIIQDPYDLWNFCTNMKLAGGGTITFDVLISEDGPWELTDATGLLLPCLKMVEPGVCSFLNANGRCSIHAVRSGLCRLYPLGRIYESLDRPDSKGLSESLSFYLLDDDLGCPKLTNLSEGKKDGIGEKILISEWLGIPSIDKYEEFLLRWHEIRNIAKALCENASAEGSDKLNQSILQVFYAVPYEKGFYEDFNNRYTLWKKSLGL